MKTAIFVSCLLAGGSLMIKTNNTSTTFLSYPSKKPGRNFSSMPVAPVRIIVNKSNYELSVYDAKGWYATYPVVFGNSSLEDKKMEGDRNTPEGTFTIVSKRVHDKWDRVSGVPNRE